MGDLSAAPQTQDIDSKIADFMADIDEIVLGKKSTDNHEQSEWKECFDETSQAIYYWNSKTNECSWQPPTSLEEKSLDSSNLDGINKKKRPPSTINDGSPKKLKKPSLIAEYTSSESASSEEEDDIDELLDEVLDKEEKIDAHPLFEENCRAAITRLTDLSDQTRDVFTLRIQLETRLEDCLTGHLSKSYAVSKLEQALIQIEELERTHLASTALPAVSEAVKAPLTTSEMALLLSLPPPPPPPSPPPPPVHEGDATLQLFYAQLNCDGSEPVAAAFNTKKTSMTMMKSDEQPQHHQNHHHKDRRSKPSKTMPTNLIQKWTHAQQELHGIADIDDS